jgi:hypothetical protein
MKHVEICAHYLKNLVHDDVVSLEYFCWHVYRQSVLVIDGKIRVYSDGKT